MVDCQSDSTAEKAFASELVCTGSIHKLPEFARSVPECRARNKTWAFLGVAQREKKIDLDSVVYKIFVNGFLCTWFTHIRSITSVPTSLIKDKWIKNLWYIIYFPVYKMPF